MQNQSMETQQLLEKGLELFNQSQFLEAHEYFESAWRETSDESREFYRALLHLSGGFYRLSQGRPSAAKKFFMHAQLWLTRFSNPFLGINTDLINNNLLKMIKSIESGNSTEQILNQNSFQIQIEDHPR